MASLLESSVGVLRQLTDARFAPLVLAPELREDLLASTFVLPPHEFGSFEYWHLTRLIHTKSGPTTSKRRKVSPPTVATCPVAAKSPRANILRSSVRVGHFRFNQRQT